MTADGGARGYTETVWNSLGGGAGSGCSTVIAKPAWQNDPSCTMRMEADISADADPNTGPAIYDTYANSDGVNGWVVVGGTSASSPFSAGLFASAGIAGVDPSYVYSHTAGFWDVLSGNNGDGGNYMCTGGAGYDGPTGWGTPNGSALVNSGGAVAQPAPPATRTVPALAAAAPAAARTASARSVARSIRAAVPTSRSFVRSMPAAARRRGDEECAIIGEGVASLTGSGC